MLGMLDLEGISLDRDIGVLFGNFLIVMVMWHEGILVKSS